MLAKRHPSLIPLSHDHHHGLVLAFRLREGLPRLSHPGQPHGVAPTANRPTLGLPTSLTAHT